jgi:hypothetical protein
MAVLPARVCFLRGEEVVVVVTAAGARRGTTANPSRGRNVRSGSCRARGADLGWLHALWTRRGGDAARPTLWFAMIRGIWKPLAGGMGAAIDRSRLRFVGRGLFWPRPLVLHRPTLVVSERPDVGQTPKVTHAPLRRDIV